MRATLSFAHSCSPPCSLAPQLHSDVEVFTWLLESTTDHKITNDTGKVTWTISVVHDLSKLKNTSNMMQDQMQSQTIGTAGSATAAMPAVSTKDTRRHEYQFEYVKDDIEAVLPIAKNWDLMNTAVLTGRQVSQVMKVFIVSQGGKVADVTLQSSCQAEDESVIKVSSSCSSVYVDGSEARGSSNASIVVRYGTYAGLAKFIVWMPEFPLEVSVSDFRLSQIKGWKIPDEHFGGSGHHGKKLLHHRRRKRSYAWNKHSAAADHHDHLGNGLPDRSTCRTRYQQSSVDVYARFLAIDQDSGRVSYLISRRTGLRVTDLVQPLLRVADPKIASLRGRILQGRAMGRTDVQVLSPITGRVIGAKEIRVGSDRVSIARLVVHVVSGLQLNITPDAAVENGYVAETSVTRRLTAQYQEGLLDMDLEFSDGSRTPLRDISVDDYLLLVESLDTEVVAFAPMLASHHPRVIAVGEGDGDLLRVTLLLAEECRTRRNVPLLKQSSKAPPGPLATALAAVQVNFSAFAETGGAAVGPALRSDAVQNDGFLSRDRGGGGGGGGGGGRGGGDLSDILIGIPLKEHNADEPTVQARQHRGGAAVQVANGRNNSPYHRRGGGGGDDGMSSIEIGMYLLMTAFCLAIIVFVASCFVYANKFRQAGGVEAGRGGGCVVAGLQETSLDAMGGMTAAGGGGMGGMGALKLLREPRAGRGNRESTQNAHDWVWLGRSTMDRSSMVAEAGAAASASGQRGEWGSER